MRCESLALVLLGLLSSSLMLGSARVSRSSRRAVWLRSQPTSIRPTRLRRSRCALLVVSAALLPSVLIVGSANATPVTWMLAGDVYGEFVYDADIDVYSDVFLRWAVYEFFNVQDGNDSELGAWSYGGEAMLHLSFAPPLSNDGGLTSYTGQMCVFPHCSITVSGVGRGIPVPEPSTALLLAAGLLSLSTARRRPAGGNRARAERGPRSRTANPARARPGSRRPAR
jgi:hypothetical protein